MSISNQHPLHVEKQQDWEMMRDTYKGQRAVKEKGQKYLPATPGMLLDGMGEKEIGREAYNSYRIRAIFPEYVKQAVENYVGMLWRRPATIKLPAALEAMRERATPNGESLVQLLRRINEEQLVSGRAGLLLDMPESAEVTTLPYIAMYAGESIINWDENATGEGHNELNFVVLNETALKRTDNFSWKTFQKFRLLALGDLQANEPEGTAEYRQGVFDDDTGLDYSDDRMFAPMYRGKPLSKIPFVFVNTKDIVATPDEPPLLALANQSLAIYRGEADYRQTLFMMGQDTLVVVGGFHNQDGNDERVRIGAGSMLHVEVGGDAKFIGVDGRGLPEQRYALVNDRLRAEIQSGQLSNTHEKVESGIALQTRLGAQTSTLMQIAITGAGALQHILRMCAEWVGANPEEVIVEPNLDFATNELEGQDLLMYMQAVQLGAPLSRESIHRLMMSKGLTTTPFKDELKQIEKEKEIAAPIIDPASGLNIPGKPIDKPADGQA